MTVRRLHVEDMPEVEQFDILVRFVHNDNGHIEMRVRTPTQLASVVPGPQTVAFPVTGHSSAVVNAQLAARITTIIAAAPADEAIVQLIVEYSRHPAVPEMVRRARTVAIIDAAWWRNVSGNFRLAALTKLNII